MDIYSRYERRGLKDYKLRTIADVKELHNIDILNMQGLDMFSGEDRNLVIKLFINYLNGYGCGSREQIPIRVEKVNNNKFKVIFKDKEYSYLYRDGTVG